MTWFKKDVFYPVGQEIPFNSKNRYTSLDKKTIASTSVGQWRLSFLIFAFSLAFFILISRLFYLTVIKKKPILITKEPPAFMMQRGNILDRNGVILATDLPIVDLFVDGKFVSNAQTETQKLLEIFPDLDFEKTYKKIKSKSRFTYLKRNLTPTEQYAVNHLGFPSLNFSTREKRIYPQNELFSHILGLTDVDNNGLSGIEKAFNRDLKIHHKNVQLSVDVNVQDMVRETLLKYIEKFEATGGLSVVMNVNTQEVLALVSLPDYNPNTFEIPSKDAFFNKASLGVYEFGSIMKVFSVALGLKTGKITPDDEIDATKPFKMAHYYISDYHAKNRMLKVPEVLIYSSNIGSSKIALMAGTENQKEFLTDLGFLEPLDIELPEKAHPMYPKVWRDINTATISYGYGMSTSPLHIMSGLSALVNGGLYRAPTFLLGGNKNKPLRRILSPKMSEEIRYMMRAVSDIGSGKNANVKGYLIGGKTGSAEMQDERGRYISGSLRTSFIAAFPMNKPKYALMVMLENPKKSAETFWYNTSGWNAVPCAGEIIQKIAPYLGVSPQSELEKPPYIEAAYVIKEKEKH
ncbi:MAG: penicillin-binding protein 2 [Alphaproteobacteria bacterium]|nr:penicillin-binding protein 2 [Alphaproteobacteria bacterium]